MNCKPGDLAVIVRCDCEWEQPDLGTLVDVLRTGDDWSNEGDSRLHWLVRVVSGDGLRWQNPSGLRGISKTANVPDDCLRPIRDPGDDAVDQTLVPGYVKDEVTA